MEGFSAFPAARKNTPRPKGRSAPADARQELLDRPGVGNLGGQRANRGAFSDGSRPSQRGRTFF